VAKLEPLPRSAKNRIANARRRMSTRLNLTGLPKVRTTETEPNSNPNTNPNPNPNPA